MICSKVFNTPSFFNRCDNRLLKSNLTLYTNRTINGLIIRKATFCQNVKHLSFKQNKILFLNGLKFSTFSYGRGIVKTRSKSLLHNAFILLFVSLIVNLIQSHLFKSWHNLTYLLALDNEGSNNESTQQVNEKKTKKKKTFKENLFIEYENRIRSFSNPEKIFSYFATIKLIYDSNGYEIFMTPDDFVRAVTPGMLQPKHFRMDQFRKIEYSKDFSFSTIEEGPQNIEQLEQSLKPNGILKRLTKFGLINYFDFLLLLTVISVSRHHFEIGFRMFDLNGDGKVDYQEFEKVRNVVMYQTNFGKKIGSSLRNKYLGHDSALSKYFFGPNLKDTLTIDKFLNFQREVQNELLTSEFERKRPDGRQKISEFHFCELLLIYSHFSRKVRQNMLKNIKEKYPSNKFFEDNRGISFDDYMKFYDFLQNINDVDLGLSFFNLAGAAIDEATLKHAAKVIANVELDDHLIEVVFTLFDRNGDGRLSSREFITVMKERLRRGHGKSKESQSLFENFSNFWRKILS